MLVKLLKQDGIWLPSSNALSYNVFMKIVLVRNCMLSWAHFTKLETAFFRKPGKQHLRLASAY